jgi:hypothetical protein
MLELLPNLPDGVVGFSASGQVTAGDYETVAIPAVEACIKQHGKVCFLYQIGPAFTGFTPGAMWDDAKLGMAHLIAVKKAAIVTDVHWIGSAVRFFRLATPGHVRLFGNDQFAEAAEWVVS